MTPADRLSRIRELLGDGAITAATGLDRRNIQRIASGQATLNADTGATLRRALAAAAAVAGVRSEVDAYRSVARICADLRTVAPRAAAAHVQAYCLLMASPAGRLALPDLSEALTGDRDSSSARQIVTRLEEIGAVTLETLPSPHGVPMIMVTVRRQPDTVAWPA